MGRRRVAPSPSTFILTSQVAAFANPRSYPVRLSLHSSCRRKAQVPPLGDAERVGTFVSLPPAFDQHHGSHVIHDGGERQRIE